MPTANTTSPRRAKTRARSAGKAAAGKSTGTRRAASSARSRTRAKATQATSARTNAANRAQANIRQTATTRDSGVFGDYAERAVLIQVGAALIAREKVLAGVNDTLSSYTSPSKAQAQLRRFERRGVTARNRLEREVRKTRVRVERELRQRRREIERTVSDLEDRRGSVAKTVPELANRVQERILSLV
ncbi:MAG TPA: hypothetical protein VKG38_19655 [Solirubrobacteraceae bacterium]|nr:hypothetical protein [Solirubrobacteraceae bacterium]